MLASAVALLLATAAAPLRDVIATATASPLVTSAEVELYRADARAKILAPGGRILVRYPGVTGLTVGGQAVAVTAVGRDLVAANVAAGSHELAVTTGGAAPEAASLAAHPAAIATPAAWEQAVKAAGPGGELIIRDGIYRDWRLAVTASGSAERPLVVRPETPGGVTFRGNSSLAVTGNHVQVRGLRFEHCGPGIALHLTQGSNGCRVTQCQFFWCGNPRSSFGNVVRIDLACNGNRVDHCHFTGSKSMSLAQRVTPPPAVTGRDNRFDHNLFRDIARYWINGQENIQIGQNQRGQSGEVRSDCLVEHNVFDHAWGDGEILSNKSSHNVIRYNLAAHCPRSAVTLRGGDEVRFEGNVMVNNGGGLRIIGRRHTIVNNLVVGAREHAFILETGSQDGSYTASEDALIAHNTFLDCPSGAVSTMPTTPTRSFAPRRTRLQANLALGCGQEPLSLTAESESQVAGQLTGAAPASGFHPLAPLAGLNLGAELLAQLRDGGAGGLVTLDRLGRPRSGRPDIGADELEAGPPQIDHPELPAAPVYALELYQDEACYDMDAAPGEGWQTTAPLDAPERALHLTDSEATLQTPLPAELVLTWEYRPSTYAATATLDLGEVQITCGGVEKDDKPSGVIRLSRGAAPLAEGCDVAQPYQSYRARWDSERPLVDLPAPDPKRWYRFELVKLGRTLYLSLVPAGGAEAVPVMVWHETEQPLRLGDRLRLRQQGEGRWRNVRLWRAAYRGDRQPPEPRDLRAAAERGRIGLSWTGGRAEVFRGQRADFVADDSTRLAVVDGSRYDDFEVVPGQQYLYQLRAVNRLGYRSAPVTATATAGAGGPLPLYLPVGHGTVHGRLARGMSIRPYVWAPPGLPAAMSGAPEADRLELEFTLAAPARVRLWGLVQAPHDAADSFYFAVDQGPWQVWYTGVHPEWGWSPLGDARALGAGPHRLRVAYREQATRLAALLLSDDLALTPAP